MTLSVIEFYKNFQKDAVDRIAAPYSTEYGSLIYWRSHILFTIIMTGWIFGTIAIIASIGLFIRENAWGLALLDAFCFVLCATLIFSNRIRYEIRSSIALFIFFAIGNGVILSVGPLSGGSLWLFTFAVLVAVLLGLRPALVAVFLNAFSLSVIAWLISTGKIGQDFPFFKTPQAMLATGVNFIVLNAIAAFSVAVLVKGLVSTHEKKRILTENLEIEQIHLTRVKKDLEVEIEERKQAKEALQESEAKYRLLAENVTDIIWAADMDLNITYHSPSVFQVRGFTPEEAKGHTLEESMTAESYKLVMQVFRQEMEKIANQKGNPNSPITLELELYCKDGSTIMAEVQTNLTFSPDGQPEGLIGVTRDISDRKKLENELRQSQKMESIGNLAGGIAHDFNNILSSIIGFTELALDDVAKGTPQEDNLQEVYTSGKRARDLVKQILAFARQSDEKRTPIQVDTIAKEVLKLIRSTIPTTIEIRENIQSHSLIMGNPSQVHQLFMNLCTNAAQAMEDAGGVLGVKLTDVEYGNQAPRPLSELKSGNYMKVTISDTGPGILPDIINSIFEPYFTTKGVGEGTGMGLALVHGIVESYGGKITVDSELGKGTVFSIYLPITKKREGYGPYEKENLPSGTETILFVDDELPIVKMGSQILERLGYQVTVRTSSVEALELFRSKPGDFDLVITDMTMPNITGDELAMELIAFRSNIPVILCTGYSKKINDETAAEIGIKAFAYKPIVKANLAKTVRKVLDEAMGECSVN
jgi:PAS domain S-box-containing protein